MKRICVLGLGYIGLPTAAVFAAKGCDILGVDTNENVVKNIAQGEIHILEPGLATLVNDAISKGNLHVATAPEAADVFIIAVPTPINEDKTADMSCVESAAEAILPYIKEGNLVILESTSPPRTTVDLLLPILQKSGLKIGDQLFVAYCPERVLPGEIIHELRHNNRIIGGINAKSADYAEQVYRLICEGEILKTSAVCAEMSKLMENTYRDVNIALANELVKISYDLDIDAAEVISLANMHPRVNLHLPGPGVGGHCLAVDPWFIVEKSEQARLIGLSREINDSMPEFVVSRINKILGGQKNQKVGLLGVAYKGNVDDCRESPALAVIDKLSEFGYDVASYDPYVKDGQYGTDSLQETVANASLLVVLTNHQDFQKLNISHIGSMMKQKAIFDTRNMLDSGAWKREGFSVENFSGDRIL